MIRSCSCKVAPSQLQLRCAKRSSATSLRTPTPLNCLHHIEQSTQMTVVVFAVPSAASSTSCRLQPHWGLQPHAFKSTEPAGALHLFHGSALPRMAASGGTFKAGRNYSAVWTSSALRAAANASLATGGMHLMLAGLPRSFTVGRHTAKSLPLAIAFASNVWCRR